MGTISKNFSFKEFEQSDVAKQKKIVNIIHTAEVRDNIKALVDNVLQPLRDIWGEPLKINSGYRDFELNAAVGGVPTSQHTKGQAADIAAKNPYALAQCAIANDIPFDQMILYPTFVHFSYKADGENRGQILYNKTYKGKKL